MRRGLKSGVGSDLRGSGDRSRRVSGKLGLGFESSSTTKTNLAHDLLGEFSGCYNEPSLHSLVPTRSVRNLSCAILQLLPNKVVISDPFY